MNIFLSYGRWLLALLFLNLNLQSKAQEVLLQGWYWDYPKTAAGKNWTDTLDLKLNDLSAKGFSHIWLPPFSRSSFGSNSNGYDPKDLYDLGSYGLGPTGFGTRSQVDTLIKHIRAKNMKAVADVVYNHRDGGKPEINPSVEGWIENFNCTKRNNGDNPFPSDRVRMILPIGGSTGNNAGDYYIKIASASKHPDFYGKEYKFYAVTKTMGFQNLPATNEFEPNGGGDCGQGNNTATLGRDFYANIDNVGSCGGGCGVDEFKLTLNASNFNSAGDTLFIYLSNTNGNYSDHFIYGIWNGAAAADVQSQLKYQTYTDFMNMPSGRATMNYSNFKPNGNPTNLNGDWDSMLFFYDYDQAVPDTRQELIDWTQWLRDSIKIEGLRMDAVKHFDPAFLSKMFDSLYLTNQTPDLVVGEFYDFNASALKGWVDNVESGMAIPAAKTATTVRAFDFALRGSLEAACDQPTYDSRQIFNSGIVYGANGNKNQAVTFVNNHDFRSGSEMVDNDPELAYAYILAHPNLGIPTVFYPDYYGTDLPTGPDANLKASIDRLMDLRNEFIINSSGTEHLNRFGTPHSINYFQGSADKTLAFISVGGGLNPIITPYEALTVINFSTDTLQATIPLGALSMEPNGAVFSERTGKSLLPFSFKTAGALNVAVPPRSYGIYVNVTDEDKCNVNNPVYVDKGATGSNDGGSWANAFNDLQSVIALANSCDDLDTIYVKEGTYKPTFTNDRSQSFTIGAGKHIYGGFPFLGTPTFAQRNPLIYPTVLSGNIGNTSLSSDNSFHTILTSTIVSKPSTLSGFVVQDGNANGIAENGQGGGLLNRGNLLIDQCKFMNNNAINGAAIYNVVSTISNIKNTISINNTGATDVKNEAGATVNIMENVEIKN